MINEMISTKMLLSERALDQPDGVRLYMQIEPPIVEWPVRNANLGETTLIKKGSCGYFSGKITSYSNFYCA